MRRILAATLSCSISAPIYAVDIDTRAGADVTIWGARGGDQTGKALATGDVNGDRVTDVLVDVPGWEDNTGATVGQICALLGPLALPSVIDLWTTDPSFCIEAGQSIRVYDLDRDGIDDMIVGSSSGCNGRTGGGAIAVFRGRTAWPAALTFTDADWVFCGAELDDGLTWAVAGDLNGDSEPDVAVFASGADGLSNSRLDSGEGYVFFGPVSRWPRPTIDLASDTPDVHILGADGKADNPWPNIGDQLAYHNRLLIANVVGGSTPDLIFSSLRGCGLTNAYPGAGEVYVLRGRAAWPSEIDLRALSASDLVVYGQEKGADLEAFAVGDLNNDNANDLVVCAIGYAPSALMRPYAGTCDVFHGGALAGVIDLATTTGDRRVVGPDLTVTFGAFFGEQVQIGDVNGDGYPDLVASAAGLAPLGRKAAGGVLVVSGCLEAPLLRDLALQPPELSILGADPDDGLGVGMTIADLNGDGLVDILAGAGGSDSRLNTRVDAGEIHMVLGREFGPSCDIVADAGVAVEVCAGGTLNLNGAGSVVINCTGSPEFRWLKGSNIVRGWSPDPRTTVTASTSTTYRLEVRCGDCARSCGGFASMVVTVIPDVTPADLENTLRTLRSGLDVSMSWASAPNAETYRVYRQPGDKTSWPTSATITGLTTTTTSLPDIPAVPDSLVFYRVVGASCSGLEGP